VSQLAPPRLVARHSLAPLPFQNALSVRAADATTTGSPDMPVPAREAPVHPPRPV
jgi:hypothetical protein